MNPVSIVIYTVLSVLVLVGLSLQSKVRSAAAGNFLAMGAMIAAIIYTIIEYSAAGKAVVWIGLAIGLTIGLVWAFKVKMVQMPQTVGLLNGIGGLASAMVGSFELLSSGKTLFTYATSGLAVAVGCITFMGSLIAALKLAGKMNGRPKILPGHSTICTSLLIAGVVGIIMGCFEALRIPAFIIIALSTLAFGYFFAIRVGGADMPITISLLNSLSGVAGAIAGMAIYNILLVAIGGIVGSSGVLLTQIMCRAMNRKLSSILLGKSVVRPAAKPAPVKEAVKEEAPAPVKEAEPEAAELSAAEEPAAVPTLSDVKDLIIVPGYGMALSQAQHKVKELADMMEAKGCRVRYAIHPVAGRMPGHMNVLLAEVDVDYDLLCELESINDDFKNCDAVLVVGASDVMNPAAREAEGTPIYGMPILNVDQAPMVFVCNYNLEPGYAGVHNPIYDREEGIRILLGDAKESLQILIDELSSAKKAAAAVNAPAAEETAAKAPTLADVKDLIIVPGYGMALSQAQSKVKELADKMEAKGCRVRYAIHPVAGRMPGHMNVLLAEVDVDYDLLYELDAINDDFKNCDAVLVVGASDVMNPAAREAEGTPIYGMPILNVDQAPMVFVCNYNLEPGYAGVHNPIYDREEGIRILLGDAKDSLQILIDELNEKKAAPVSAAAPAKAAAPDTVRTLEGIKDLIIVPGYGMALSQAQAKVKALADMMEAKGCRVRYAIHPVAGRMPGHMNVLLAEVDVDYDLLCELDAINDDFKNCDAVLVVGASDVMNPAAREAEGTPIYGMPILNVDQAPMVFVCNYNLEPGYAGVPNPIYDRKSGIRILLGDAKESLQILMDELREKKEAPAAEPAVSEAVPEEAGNPDASRTLEGIKDLIIVPGYGMALSQAQRMVKRLADKMESKGCRVRYAIHPVAGRMPGHMNVLLAEVDVDYDLLCELDAINDDFKNCDAVLVVGASDVMNPAAREAEGTPIYGMPILNVDQAPMVFVCNYNLEPGYAGVPNPIYDRKSGIRILLGDAKESLQILLDELN